MFIKLNFRDENAFQERNVVLIKLPLTENYILFSQCLTQKLIYLTLLADPHFSQLHPEAPLASCPGCGPLLGD